MIIYAFTVVFFAAWKRDCETRKKVEKEKKIKKMDKFNNKKEKKGRNERKIVTNNNIEKRKNYREVSVTKEDYKVTMDNDKTE